METQTCCLPKQRIIVVSDISNTDIADFYCRCAGQCASKTILRAQQLFAPISPARQAAFSSMPAAFDIAAFVYEKKAAEFQNFF